MVLDDYQHVASTYADWDSLDAEVVYVDRHLEGDPLVETIGSAEVIVAMRERTPFDEELFDRLPALELLVTTGMVNASIDLAAASAHGVTVCGTSALTHPTVEHTWALILAAVRHIPTEDANIRAGRWQTTIGTGLTGKTLGLMGLGRLGSRVAAIGQAFGMGTIAWSQNLDPERGRSLGVRPVTKEELVSQSDILSIHLRSSARTHHIVGRDELALMRPTSYLVNTSRGHLVDNAALIEVLHAGRIAGAALDVYDSEPLAVDDPLRSTPRTVLTPHVGYVTEDTYAVCFTDAVEDIAAWRDGSPVRVLTA